MTEPKQNMAEKADPIPVADTASPPLVPDTADGMLQEAQSLLSLMQQESTDTVALLAKMMAVSAHNAGELAIAEAAEAIHRGVSRGGPVILARPIQRLSAAITAAETARKAA